MIATLGALDLIQSFKNGKQETLMVLTSHNLWYINHKVLKSLDDYQ